MSRTVINSSYKYRMTYPNATHFAFIPAIVKLENLPATATSVTLSVNATATEQSFIEHREVHANSVTFDIQRFLQMIFDQIKHSVVDYTKAIIDSPLRHTVEVNVMIADGLSVKVPKFAIDSLWGVISRGESSGGVMTRRWFVNYPFTIDLFTKSEDTFYVDIDDDPSKSVEFYNHEADATGATMFRRALINPSKLLNDIHADRTVHIATPHGIVLENDTETTGLTAYTLLIDRRTRGVYLRWIDPQGRYCYYLFLDLGTATAVSATSWEESEIQTPTAYIDGVNIATDTRQSFAVVRSQTIGAKLVDAEMYAFLLGAARSPIVDVFDGYDGYDVPLWHRVNVVAGSYTQTVKTLQDFQMTISEPKQSTQIL